MSAPRIIGSQVERVNRHGLRRRWLWAIYTATGVDRIDVTGGLACRTVPGPLDLPEAVWKTREEWERARREADQHRRAET